MCGNQQKERELYMNKNGFEDRSEDRRVRKSKKALEEALIRLLAKKTITEITVTELTEEADIHRGTFYNHYKDTMDLKIQTDRDIAAQLTELLSSVPESALKDGPYPLLSKVLQYFEDHRDIARMLVSESGSPHLLKELCASISERCMGGAFRDQSRYSSRYATAGMQGMIVTWVEDGMRMPAGEMAQMIERMMGSSQPQAAYNPLYK